jgi:Rrf2 family iron-sulfur cluster assembly transcriptional regulator
MKFSTKAEYGLRAIVELAKSKTPVSLASIARQEGLSLAYLERLFASLKRAGLVTSFKGLRGGYTLTRSAAKISVAEIITALEGSLYEIKCGHCKVCGCNVHSVWDRLYKQIDQTLNSITLKSLIKK